MDKSQPEEKASLERWVVVLTTLFISLVLWGAVILIGRAMIGRLD